MLFISSKYSAVLDASAKYITYMGYFYWVLSILNVCRQTTQGIGYSGLAIFSGVIEMIARCFVSLVFVPIAGYTAICCADQTAWMLQHSIVYLLLVIVLKRFKKNDDIQEVSYDTSFKLCIKIAGTTKAAHF